MDPNEMRELGVVKIAAPCRMSWSRMSGTARVRFCGACALNVYDLSELTADEARALMREYEGQRLCVRLWTRPDGTVITKDCPRGLALRKRWRTARARAGIVMALSIVITGVLDVFGSNLRALILSGMGVAGDDAIVQRPQYVMGKTMKNFGANNTSQY